MNNLTKEERKHLLDYICVEREYKIRADNMLDFSFDKIESHDAFMHSERMAKLEGYLFNARVVDNIRQIERKNNNPSKSLLNQVKDYIENNPDYDKSRFYTSDELETFFLKLSFQRKKTLELLNEIKYVYQNDDKKLKVRMSELQVLDERAESSDVDNLVEQIKIKKDYLNFEERIKKDQQGRALKAAGRVK
ncbi:hypothetical protein CFI10_11620 [Marinobacterium iners]|uniref:hypothetical protein n=1 Tax=Marinobacterium iners TaxID=48076 RepID=UPI001A9084CD|nr:hypothetical protein [Marinobacterium iners]QSR35638.1 hypothetical protein CFI10_11620 [Marinobacterium iners]